MGKRIIITILLSTLMISCLIGCEQMKAASPGKLSDICKSYGLTLYDAMDQYPEYSNALQNAIYAKKKQYTLKYFATYEDENAKKLYSIYKRRLAKKWEKRSLVTEVTGKDYCSYILESTKRYISVTRVKNTVLVVNVKAKYKDEAEKIMNGVYGKRSANKPKNQ